jgi:hypothetical protein
MRFSRALHTAYTAKRWPLGACVAARTLHRAPAPMHAPKSKSVGDGFVANKGGCI